MNNWNKATVSETPILKGVDWIFIHQQAYHHDGTRKRQIRIVIKVLNDIMKEKY